MRAWRGRDNTNTMPGSISILLHGKRRAAFQQFFILCWQHLVECIRKAVHISTVNVTLKHVHLLSAGLFWVEDMYLIWQLCSKISLTCILPVHSSVQCLLKKHREAKIFSTLSRWMFDRRWPGTEKEFSKAAV